MVRRPWIGLGHVVSLKGEEVEGDQPCLPAGCLGSRRLEFRCAVLCEADGLSVDHDGISRERPDRVHDGREHARPILPVTGPQPNHAPVAPRQNALAIPLQFVNLFGAGRHLTGQDRLTGRDKAHGQLPRAGRTHATPLNHADSILSGRNGSGWQINLPQAAPKRQGCLSHGNPMPKLASRRTGAGRT